MEPKIYFNSYYGPKTAVELFFSYMIGLGDLNNTGRIVQGFEKNCSDCRCKIPSPRPLPAAPLGGGDSDVPLLLLCIAPIKREL